MKVFHGSSVIVKKPKIITNGFFKDFVYGFYCTNKEKQAQRWALTRKNGHIVNQYHYREGKDLTICRFLDMSEEWLEFIVASRSGKEKVQVSDTPNRVLYRKGTFYVGV